MLYSETIQLAVVEACIILGFATIGMLINGIASLS